MRKTNTRKVQVQKVPFLKRLLGTAKRVLLPVQKVQRHRSSHRNPNANSAEHTGMEAEHRRRFTRGSIESQVGHLWDASEKPPRMEELLRKHSVRTRKDEEVQRGKEEKRARSVKLVEWTKRDAYNVFVAFLKNIEADAYYRLRHPDHKPGESIERYIGRQDGKLEVIEDIRLMFAEARLTLQEARAEQEKQNETTTQQQS